MTNFDFALVHSFWLSQKNKNAPVGQSLLGKIEVKILAKLYKEGEIKNFVLLTGKLWGNSYPAVSEIARQDLINLGIPVKNIVTFTDNFDTVSELKSLDKFIKDHDGSFVEICTTSDHKKSIEKLRKILNVIEISIFSAEEIDPKAFTSRKQFHIINHKIYEWFRRFLLDLGIKPQEFSKLAGGRKNGPSKNFFLPTDEYYLPSTRK